MCIRDRFALRAEQRVEIAQGNCTAMLSQIREELNTPTDNEQLLWLKRMSKFPHWEGRYTIGRREKLERKCWEERENKMLGVGRSGEISMRRQFFLWGHGEFGKHCDPLWSPGMRLPSAWLHLTEKAWNQTLTHLRLPVLPNILSNLLEALTAVYSPTHVDTSIKTKYIRN